MNEAPLELLAVSKRYGQVSALTDVTFRCEPGVTGLVGKNGAGKSTILKLAAGLLAPSHGSVLVFGGSPWSDLATRARIGLCPDLDRCFEQLTGRAFVRWMLQLHGLGRKEADARARHWLAELGLADAMDRAIKGYSKGMRQRTKLAQALAHAPQLVLLDEPLTGLDPIARHEVGERIRGLGRTGATVLVSSHVLHELQSVADRVVLAHQGRVLAEGAVAELRAQLEDRPHKLMLRSKHPRELAARLTQHPLISAVEFVADGLKIETRSGAGLHESLTRLGAEEQSLIEEVLPLDDSLEAVFGYLVA